MPDVLAIADDLTGALEVGAKFAGQGIRALVTTQPVCDTSYPVSVIDTESRHLPPEAAAVAVSAAAFGSYGCILYKKTDSTLRGNIAAELRALLALRPESRIVYVGAYPALGRTVRNGHLFVNQAPVHESAFARDALNPIGDSSIVRLLGDLPCTICEGESDADVHSAVADALRGPGFPILAGPASVAEALAQLLDVLRQPVSPWPRVTRCLIVNGSRHEASARQIAHAEAHGVVGRTPWSARVASDPLLSRESGLSDNPGRPTRASAAEQRVRPTLDWQVFRMPSPACGTASATASLIGAAVVRCLDASGADAIMVFGGDTVFGILKALGCPPLEPIGEVVTGVPVSRVVGRNLTLISKAGGFGEDSLIGRVREALHGK
jgi:uncharacterized protein YgbK (DUF1537 family)